MPATLFQKDLHVKRVTTLGYTAARALNDPVRIKILEVLEHQQMSAEEIVSILGNSGYRKATTTIRHHLDTLKNAGLIQATKMVEARGAVIKYYSPTLRAFSYETPIDFEIKNAKLIEEVSSRMLKILRGILEEKKFASTHDNKNNRCSLCKRDHFKEYLALEIINAAIAKAMERKEYEEIVSGTDQSIKSSKT
jgi:DNA-binding transcriptional ArsR family regulator